MTRINKKASGKLRTGLYRMAALISVLFISALLFSSVNNYTSRQAFTKNDAMPEDRAFRNENLEARFPKNVWDGYFTFSYEPNPFEHTETHSSIAPSLKFRVSDSRNNSITKLNKPFEFTYDYNDADLKNIKEDTLAFYRYDEQSNKWEAIPTELDMSRKTATSQSVYVTSYALMGEVIDKIAPVTYATIEGKTSDGHKYESPVVIKLLAKDNNGGFGVKDTIYGINDESWEYYVEPFVIENKGEYEISYQSSDLVGNVEDIKTAEIVIE